MAFNKQEEEIIRWSLDNGKTPAEIKQAIVRYRTTGSPKGQTVPEETPEGMAQTAIGAGKGLLKSAIGTARTLAEIGRPIQAALDPTRTYSEVKAEADANSPLEGKAAERIDSQLEAKNPDQRTGEIGAFVVEALFPVAKLGKATGLAGKASDTIGATLDGIGSRVRSLGAPEQVKDRIIDAVSTLDDRTKTALSRTPMETFQQVLKQGQEAMLDDRNRTPLETVGESVANALRQVKDQASAIGERKSQFLKLPEAFDGEAIKKFNEGMQSFLNSRNLIENDKTIVKQIVSQFKSLGDTPTKGQVDKFIDFAQDALYAGEKNLTLPTSNKTTGKLKSLIGELNENLKNQLPDEYRSLNDQYRRMADLMSELNIKLGKEAGNAGSLVKRLFSPSDARTKELFAELEKLTDQDFFRDARLAKFVMDVLGDNRAASLLDEIPTSATGIIGKVIEFGKKQLADPIKSAERLIRRSQ